MGLRLLNMWTLERGYPSGHNSIGPQHDTRALSPKVVAQTNMNPNMAAATKYVDFRAWINSECRLVLSIADDSEMIWTWIRWHWKVMKLFFQPYKDLAKQTPYVSVVLYLVQSVSRIRCSEVRSPTWTWTSMCTYTTGKKHICPRPLVPVTALAGTNVQI